MASERPGPFDRILRSAQGDGEQPDRAVVYVVGTIAGLALLLLILVLPPISILNRDGSDLAIPATPAEAETYKSKVRSGMPKLPAGLVAASPMFDLSAPAERRGASRLTVPLKELETEQRNLALYTYVDGDWKRLADATLLAGGEMAAGDVDALPGNVVVLRRSRATLQVAGSLPAATTLDPRSEPALTTLHPVSFLPTADGALAGTPPAVPPAGYRVVPSVVALDPAVVDGILRASDLRTAHAAAIAETVRQGNYAGINIDYRSVNASLREQYSEFVQELRTALEADGRSLTLTLPMPSFSGESVDTGAYDWERLGGLADTIELAGELDQELYFQNTEAALDYVVERVDRNKLLITVTSQSVERGGDGLRSIPLVSALGIAGQVAVRVEGPIAPSTPVQLVSQNLSPAEGASGMAWDDTARAVTFSYPGLGGKRTVWMANQFSAAFRLELAQRYGLAGVTVTDVSFEGGGADIWAPVQELADSGQLTLLKPNGDLLIPAWSAAEGQLSAPQGPEVTWTAPAGPGSHEISHIVSDGVVRVAQPVLLEVVIPEPSESEAE